MILHIPYTFRLRLLGFLTHPYPEELRADLRHLCMTGTTAEVCMYNALLGKMFAQAARLVVNKCGIKMDDISVIGSHGSVYLK